MNQLRRVLAFGLPFLWTYRTRFLAGVALAVFFGLTNGAFVLATKPLFERLSPSPVLAGQTDPQSISSRFSGKFALFMEQVLPRSRGYIKWLTRQTVSVRIPQGSGLIETLANMDKIVVLEAGHIVEHGTYSQLLAQGGLFSFMAAQQGIS